MGIRANKGSTKTLQCVMFVKVALGAEKQPEKVRIELSYPKVTSNAGLNG